MENSLLDIKIQDDQDALKNPIEIWYGDQLGGSRAMPLFLKTYAEIMEKGFAGPYTAWGESNKFNVVYCTDSNQNILGGIAFEYRPLLKEGWIVLSFVAPEQRGKRINTLMLNYFEKMIKDRGGNKICSHIHIDNISRLKSAERSGMKPQYYRMLKWID
jgi:GNAT superfamily N-acetyltransferase